MKPKPRVPQHRLPGSRACAMSCALADAFWRSALWLYGRPNLARDCLALQDSFGFDVMVLLFCCFLGDGGWRIDRIGLSNLEAVVRPWRELAILPLRRRRRGLRDAPSTRAERQRLLAAEIAAERAEARRLGQWLSGRPLRAAPPAVAIAANLRTYGAYGGVIGGAGQAALLHLGRLALADYSREAPDGFLFSPHRRTRSVSMPKRSSTRPTV